MKSAILALHMPSQEALGVLLLLLTLKGSGTIWDTCSKPSIQQRSAVNTFSLLFQLMKHSLTPPCPHSAVIKTLQLLLIFNKGVFRDSTLSNLGVSPPIHQGSKWPSELARMSNQRTSANQASQKTFH